MNIIGQNTKEQDGRINTRYKFDQPFKFDDYGSIYKSLEEAGMKVQVVTVHEEGDMYDGVLVKSYPSIEKLMTEGKTVFDGKDIEYINGLSTFNNQEIYTQIIPGIKELVVSVPNTINNEYGQIDEHLKAK